eukprot:5927816-Pyramimonas_sp.AAC.1
MSGSTPTVSPSRGLLDGDRVGGVGGSRHVADASLMYRRCIAEASASLVMRRRRRRGASRTPHRAASAMLFDPIYSNPI